MTPGSADTRPPRVLSIAGTDPTGGAGIQADLKTIAAFGGYGMAVVTALVAQNTLGVRSVHPSPAAFLRDQLEAVGDDVQIDAIKIGMLHSQRLIAVVDDWLGQRTGDVVILDPVMVATSGDRLLDAAAEDAVRALCRRADLVTPNLPELAVLVDEPVATSWGAAVAQARRLAEASGARVLLKGGHLAGDACPDALVSAAGVVGQIDGARVASTNTHGTGCSLSSAMATLRAAGWEWTAALARAKAWLTGAIAAGAALEVGRGNGPIDHLHELRPALDHLHELRPALDLRPAVTTEAAAAPSTWTERAWTDAAPVRAAVDACALVDGLRTGDLDARWFAWYLAQDALYLGEYARVLARASALAPRAEEQVFWAEAAASAIAVEAELHRSHVDETAPDAAPTTLAYTDHLHAASVRGSYGELVAALLPCFWLYADLGERFADANHDAHPYRDWLATYADPAFAASTRRAIAVVDHAASEASPTERERMRVAFARSMGHELAFFEAPVRAADAHDDADAGGVRARGLV
ncbi:bifunctional hydroxymethylpyrimidine kinase/phosphomethylpyrimidine kinase [Microbacterium thalli]|uniref:Bifunctional hydroxymethylpyrimidine kinase/phosphomethylpyrimidine kinase n=1 Tax=Microbacterium thalli TaxID=3027921 RepID=A0ABT5SEP7_9MICO|nr:bifunctional hydroxymethylpyrimidine kinase/phosphomethylpyrimidine kinase [Microbacterium thalli]MDD7961286.1 bifunctional hydroxymethylpyrimidine kinase/phosphomethylpyrimidine kinase [Microbacterium thalli]